MSIFDTERIILTVDSNEYQEIEINQGDTPTFHFTIYKEGLPVNLVNLVLEVRIALAKDNYYLIQGTNITKNSSGEADIIMDTSVSQAIGITDGEIRILDSNGNQKTTFPFILKVKESVMGEITDSSYVKVTTLEKFEDNINEATIINGILQQTTQDGNTTNVELEGNIATYDMLNKVVEANIISGNTLNNNLISNSGIATTKNNTLNSTIASADISNNTLSTTDTNAKATNVILSGTNSSAITTNETLSATNLTANGNITTLGNLNTIANADIVDLLALNSSATTNITNETTQNNLAITNISELTTKNASAVTNCSNLDTKNTLAETNIANMVNYGDVALGLLESTGYGIINGLNVVAQTTPNMTVKINLGTVHMISGTRYMIDVYNSLTFDTADVANPRKDIIFVNSDGVISYITGIASATPVSPTVLDGNILLAEVYVGANVTTITSANITDKRKMKSTNDSLEIKIDELVSPNAFITINRPSGKSVGYSCFDITLNKPIWYTGTNWVDSNGTTV